MVVVFEQHRSSRNFSCYRPHVDQISVLSIPADLYLCKAAKRSTGYTTNMLFACQWACLIYLCTAASYAEFERNRVCVLNMPALLLQNRSLILFFISSFREKDMYVSYCALMIKGFNPLGLSHLIPLLGINK